MQPVDAEGGHNPLRTGHDWDDPTQVRMCEYPVTGKTGHLGILSSNRTFLVSCALHFGQYWCLNGSMTVSGYARGEVIRVFLTTK
jgi:hypothetical protein